MGIGEGDGKKSKSFLRPAKVLVRPYISWLACIKILGLLLCVPFHVILGPEDISYKVLSLSGCPNPIISMRND